MRKMQSTLLSNSLKTGLRNSRSGRILLFSLTLSLCFNVPLLFPGDDSQGARFYSGRENQIFISKRTEALDESRLKDTITNSGKSEISLRFRISMKQDKPGLSFPKMDEVLIRKTGFQDLITGDFVLLINGREAGSYRDWDSFYRAFSELKDFPLGFFLLPGEIPEVRCRLEVIYKKFVAPLNLLYLLPGKFISRGQWETIPWETNE